MSEEQALNQEIETLKQIKRTSEHDEKFAKAQYRLGKCYEFRKDDFEQAKRHYLAVSQKDDPVCYAIAQYHLGEMYESHKKDYEQAERHYLAVLHGDNREWYAIAQYRLGEMYALHKKDYKQAERHYLAVSHEDDSEWYAIAQYNLGEMYELFKEDYDQAEKHYLAVSHKDNPVWYAIAQGRLGGMYYLHKKDYEQAERHYLNVSQNDSPKWYAAAQCSLGELYFLVKNNSEQAKQHYKNVNFQDGKTEHYRAQLALALIDSEIGKAEAKTILQNDKEIKQCVSTIKKALFVKLQPSNIFERKVAHYTKPEVLFRCLEEKSPMRLNLVNLMNDPMENKVLFNWLNIHFSRDRNNIKSFVASFTFNHHSLNQFRLYGLENNVQGSGVSIVFKPSFFSEKPKDSVDFDKVTRKMNKGITSEDLNSDDLASASDGIFPLPLYRCVYFDPKSGYMTIAKRNKQSFYREFFGKYKEKTEESWKKYLERSKDNNESDTNKKASNSIIPDGKDELFIETIWQAYIQSIDETQKIETIAENLNQIKNKIEESTQEIKKSKNNHLLTTLNDMIYLSIMEISCLFKHAAFEDEDECRIMYTTDISDTLIRGPKEYSDINTTLFLAYFEINDHIDKLYLGPKCKASHQQWIEHSAEKLSICKVENSTLPLQ